MGWEPIGIDVCSFMGRLIYLSLIHMGVVRKDRFARFGQAGGSDLEHTVLPHLKLPHNLYSSVQAVAATTTTTTTTTTY